MIELLRARRSIRKYQNKSVEPGTIEILKEALLRSPSSRNINPWEFVFVTDKETLAKLAKSKPHGASFLAHAPLGIVICGDSDKSDVWVEDCSIASILAQLTAQSMGLGSCWIQIRNRSFSEEKTSERYIQELLGLADHIRIESIIAIGYPDERREGLRREMLDFGKITQR